jgi:hypothetical protein
MAWRERKVVGRSTPIIMELEDHLGPTTTCMKSLLVCCGGKSNL